MILDKHAETYTLSLNSMDYVMYLAYDFSNKPS